MDGQTIVVDRYTPEAYLSKRGDARLWELLASSRSLDKLTPTLAAEYEAPDGDVRGALEETLDARGDKGLLGPGTAAQ
jgi:hypothetical protein